MTIVQRIHQLTKEKNWTDYRLAMESGISQSTLSNLLSRGTYPSFFTLERICQALDVSMTAFFAGCEAGDLDEAEEMDKFLELYSHLTRAQRQRVLNYMMSELEDMKTSKVQKG